MKTAGVLAGLLIAASTPLNAQTLGYVGGVPDNTPMATRKPASVDLNAPALLHTTPPLHAVRLGVGVAEADRGSTTPLFAAPSLADLLVEPSARTFDIDQALATVLDIRGPAFMQRTRQRPTRPTSAGNPALTWVGVGLMVAGSIVAISGALRTCGGSVSGTLTNLKVDTHACWTHVAVGGGMGGVGWYLFANNR